MKNNSITIFTDGSSRGNPGKGGWGAIVLESEKVREFGGASLNTTNNRMELAAVIGALSNIKDNSLPIVLYTDSSYVANGAQSWISLWKKNSWMTKQKTEVLNKDLWQELDDSLKGKNIEWKIIRGHVGVSGNERCDVIATSFADGNEIELFEGDLDDYSVDLENISVDALKLTDNNRKKQKAYSYISLVDGKLERHNTWDDCKNRVSGKEGAKFRKTISKEDEEEIIKSWGFEKIK